MLNVLMRVVVWGLVYLLVTLVPLGVAMLGATPAGRGFLIEFGVGLGIVGFAMLGVQFVTTARFRWVAPYFGSDAKVQFHRETGILAMVLLLAHPILLFAADAQYLAYLNPWVNLPRAIFLSGATGALMLLIVLPLWRLNLRMSYEWWRVTHGGLAAAVMVVGLAHSLQVGHYVAGIGTQAVWIVGAGLALGLLFHTRLVKPWQMRRTPYRVVEVHADCPEVYRLVLAPDGHAGMQFRAGQYAWLTISETPCTLQQHPFSLLSSEATPERVEFGIKELGDFTATIKEVSPGTRAFLEGPYGSFSLDPKAAGAVFVVGGIGVTPALSMLRTCRDRGDRRPLLLIYANNRWEEIPFRRDLDALRDALDLEIIHVLAEPPEGWEGEVGFVTEDLLARHLASRREMDLQYFVCGPPPMMEIVEQELVAQGVPLSRLYSERFDLV
jgi:predicted ferric reductase